MEKVSLMERTSLSRADIVRRYDGRAPRYTSYPTAVQFNGGVTAETYAGWLGGLCPDRPVSLYLHVPFCAQMCWYCGCNTRAVTRHAPVGEYVELLIQEIRQLADHLPDRLKAGAIHLGGGTPNMLTPAELQAIFRTLGEVFHLDADAEVASELDPTVLTPSWVRAAASCGLTRASLGVQNLDPQVQRAVNRPETLEAITACVDWLREAGVESINLDLMYGLPRQTTANTLATLDAVLGLEPERIALFGYAHVPWMKAHQRLLNEADLPGPEARLEQSEAAAERLVAAGYRRIGLDHFARDVDDLAIALGDGSLRRNFQGYTTDEADSLIGLGTSAISRTPQGFVQNFSRELDWRAAVRAGLLPVARGLKLTADDRFRGEIIERLMCDLTVDLNRVCERHHRVIDDLAGDLAKLDGFVNDGLLEIDEGRLRVVGDGRLVIRSICTAFDHYFAPEAGRHAGAL